MTGQHPLVSIVIPSYNRAMYLSEAISSVFNQTYRPLECLVVDDGSTDNTKETVLKCQQTAPEGVSLYYYFQENSGSQSARNKGTAACKGDYIQYLDSDDILQADKLEKQVEYLQKHTDCDGVFGDWETGLPGNAQLTKSYMSDDLIAQFLTHRPVANFSFLMRAAIVRKTGDWDVRLKRNQEIDFHVRAVLNGAQFGYLQQNTGLWRLHRDERIAYTTGAPEVIAFYRKMEKLLLENGLFTVSLQKKISGWYVWYLSEHKNDSNRSLYPVMKEALRLDPQVGFYQSRKLKILRFLLGQRVAFGLWLNRFRKHNSLA